MSGKSKWTEVITKEYLEEQIQNKFLSPAVIASGLGTSVPLVYKFMNRHRVWPSGFITKTCFYCKNEYQATTVHGIARRQKYCSEDCHNKAWVKNNPERHRELSKLSRLRKPVICRECKNPIPNELRKGGKIYCSNECLSKANERNQKKYRTKKFNKFWQYKESKGCYLCGYNKFGGSLDFHHKDPEKKDRRIEGKHFSSQSPLIVVEIEKCILLCKNCHYWIHYIMRTDIQRYWSILENIK